MFFILVPRIAICLIANEGRNLASACMNMFTNYQRIDFDGFRYQPEKLFLVMYGTTREQNESEMLRKKL
ncbi:hypothetical protein L6164_036452 [Bauhinia variegata]|uniref:Uncharacterized protein n=1 Tax=Bauhinia variegata TaxID=167791 RepID=A0ACB9KH03_BAUVA|nr:hypothetical protein L6164_036452 [Bauhinia variegata]